MGRERAIAIAQTATIVFALSLGGVLGKIALSNAIVTMPAETYVTLIIGIGMITMCVYTFVIRRESIPVLTRQEWLYIALIGVGNFTIGQVGINLALEHLPAITNNYLMNFIGFVTMALSIFIMRETPYLFQIIGAGIAIAGLRVYFRSVPTPDELTGILLMGMAILAIAFTNNAARKLSQISSSLSNNILSTLALLIGGSLTVIVGLVTQWPLQSGSGGNLGFAVYTGVVGMAIGLTAWNYVLRTLRSYEASILGATGIIWTALLAIPILGERPLLHQVIGMILMLIGIALVQVRIGRLGTLFSKKQAVPNRTGQ
ncbi:MAG: DMT family transporter [Anaerolineae bacterium]|nr:DMT family transporter [Anaerolineae bacterium]